MVYLFTGASIRAPSSPACMSRIFLLRWPEELLHQHVHAARHLRHQKYLPARSKVPSFSWSHSGSGLRRKFLGGGPMGVA